MSLDLKALLDLNWPLWLIFVGCFLFVGLAWACNLCGKDLDAEEQFSEDDDNSGPVPRIM